MTVLQAPIDLSDATRQGPRVYRKQVLAKRDIDYPLPDGTKRRVSFDDEYLTDLADAFQAGAYDLVPFQLATPANMHNEDPRQYGGKVIGAEVTDDGLDLILELSADTAELVEKTGRQLGVSARIKEALEHVDGRSFKRAIRHVLGTLDPRMQGLRGWEPIDLSTEADPEVIDLTGYTEQEGPTMPSMIDLSTLTPDEREAIESYAALNGIDLASAAADDETPGVEVEPEGEQYDADDDEYADDPGPEGDAEYDGDEAGDGDEDGEPEGITDDDLEALIDAELAGVELSADADDTLDLAAGLAGIDGDERQSDRRELAAARFQLAAQEYARKGVPPHLIDLAAPILSLTDEQGDGLDLASPATGEPIDVRGIVRDMLEAVAGTIDLSAEAGYGHETEPEEQVTDLASAWTEYLENN